MRLAADPVSPLRAPLRGLCALFVAAVPWLAPDAAAERIKDVASLQGVRQNQLTGYGVVVGLDGTGDQTSQTPFTIQSMQSLLTQMGVNLPPGQTLQLKNVAAVTVTAQLPPFARPGQMLDVTVSSIGNAKSLRGGTLLLTPLKGADGRIYAMSQGNVVIGGAGASGGGSKAQVNQLNSGRVPSGATVERDVPTTMTEGGIVRFELGQSDFGASTAVMSAINDRFPGVARAADGRVIEVIPPSGVDLVAFLGQLEQLEVQLPQAVAKVIINARTGSIVMNQSVTLRESAVAHGNLTVSVSSEPQVSQPNALGSGETVVTAKTDVQIKADTGGLVTVPAAAKLADVVKALNTLGATPQDLLSILQALKAAGSLRAELEVI